MMGETRLKEEVTRLLASAGVEIDGTGPADIRVHNDGFYRRVLKEGALGLGESYMEGWWDCPAVDQFIDRILRANLEEKVKGNWRLLWYLFKSRIFNLQKISRAFQVGESHYDAGNDLYRAMLDRRLLYTSGYWKEATNLDQAQEDKLELVCRKIALEPGMTVLELGCGWGSFARYAAEKYGVSVLGVTVSREQVSLGRELCRGLPVEIQLRDYRRVKGRYDRVISIGILEHVGYKNYRTYMEVVNRTLKDDGIAFIHTIGANVSSTTCNPWTGKYIFPNGMIPSIAQIGKSLEGLFTMEDWHNFGEDYDRTLMAWHENFERAWPRLRENYNERFHRMWRYYLLSCAGGFRSRQIQLWQIVLTKPGRKQPPCRIV